ncbi:MAG: adenylyltransferase/cytidyltransferase family protein, partial [Candidatus Omnitrophica bacterium]|nr:adenylyltransferase/cytidyltransferase family protein [Candidatus Omnitrophota bacterium]
MMNNKIKTASALKKRLVSLKNEGKSIVFTNGCFDILHYGHVKYLQEAKNTGNILVVAVNSDSSVK